MQSQDSENFGVAIGALAATFGVEATKALILGYWLGLSDMDLGDLQRAVSRAIRECQFMPRPYDLRRLAGEDSPDTAALIAWGDVERSVNLGPYKHIDFTDKIINAVIRNLGGWPTFIGRFSDAETEKWTRVEFLKCYTVFAKRGVNGDVCKPLPGLSEQSVVAGRLVEPKLHRVICTAQPAAVDNQKKLTAEDK